MSFRERELELAARRERLVALANLQRLELRLRARSMAPAIGAAEVGIAAWRWMRTHPLQVAIPALALLLLRPRGAARVVRWGLQLVPLLRIARAVAALLRQTPA